jgi:DNA-binding transcriptional ArsR family regulator
MFRMWTSYDNYIDALKAISEPTRFRLVRLCAQGELTVSELMRIVGQSQPRVSRHLKLLQDAGILERFREQHWVFYRVAQEEHYQLLVSGLIKQIEKNETIIQLDQSRLIELQAARATLSETFIETELPDWLRLHEYHGDTARFESAVQDALAEKTVGHLLDVATGTGRMLKIVGPLASSGVGIDLSKKMVTVARSVLAESGLAHLTVRQEDMYQMRFAARHFDTITIDQVLYFATNPDALIKETARVLKYGGRLLVVAFTASKTAKTPPSVGIELSDIQQWIESAGLKITNTNILPGDSLDISLLVSEKAKDAT